MTTEESKTNSVKCKYCQKEFRKESTLAAHTCEQKRRSQQEKEVGVQFGLRSYLRFFEMTQGSAKNKSYADFAESPYYSAFVSFGRHIVNIRAVNPSAFIEWVIKNNKKLDHWTKDTIYEEYLFTYLRHENPKDALERAVAEAIDWSDESKAQFNHYFLYGSENKICFKIATGRISPWVLYNCDSGVEFLNKLEGENLEIVFKWIDPDYWKYRFTNYAADTEWVKLMLKEAGF